MCAACVIMSAEPGRKRAYSDDIKWRVVYQRIGMQKSFSRIAASLNIAPSTAHRLYSSFVANSFQTSRRERVRKLDSEKELYVIGMVLSSPGMYLSEMIAEIKTVTGVEVSSSTVCKLLKRYGITRKKIRQVAKQRCYQLRGFFMAQSFLYDYDMLVWIDETDSDKKNGMRKFGYELSGVTPVYHRLLTRGRRVNTIIAAMSSNEILGVECKYGSVNGDVFLIS